MKCAWCKNPKKGMTGSDGICEKCLEGMKEELKKRRGEK